MRAIPLIKEGSDLSNPRLIKILNKLISESNEHKRVTREITRNLRTNAHFSKRK